MYIVDDAHNTNKYNSLACFVFTIHFVFFYLSFLYFICFLHGRFIADHVYSVSVYKIETEFINKDEKLFNREVLSYLLIFRFLLDILRNVVRIANNIQCTQTLYEFTNTVLLMFNAVSQTTDQLERDFCLLTSR